MQGQNPIPGNSGWQVTSQIEQSDIGPAGQFVNGKRVYFTTANGHSGSVFVPLGQYSVDNVRNLINTAADILDAVGNLTSGS